ncbi:MAG: hypothetical protein A2103_04420 [Gammaproteobacteria bacterium GWF2_41_13]|nr:MAG: hypothetical protein A2103_04420 [Gammaproteobacteria bacterium GWF2_41_13]
MQTMREFDCSSRDLFSIISSVSSLRDEEVSTLVEKAYREKWNPMSAQALTGLLNHRCLTPEQAGQFVRNGLARKPSPQMLTSLFRNEEERARFNVAANQEPDFQQAKDRKAQLLAEQERRRREFEEAHRKAQLEAEDKAAAERRRREFEEAHRKAQLEAEHEKAAAVEEERDRRKIEEMNREMSIEMERMEREMNRPLRESEHCDVRRAVMACDPPCVRLAGGAGRLGFWPRVSVSPQAMAVDSIKRILDAAILLRPVTMRQMMKFPGSLPAVMQNFLVSFQENSERFIQQALREMHPQLKETAALALASEIQKSSAYSASPNLIDRFLELPYVIKGFVRSCNVDPQRPPLSPRGPGSSGH